MSSHGASNLEVWLVKIGEPLPCDGPDERLFRMGLLAREFDRRGHSVVWWSGTFNHAAKIQRAQTYTELPLWERSRLNLLHSPGYSSNVSLARIRDHRLVSKRLADGMAHQRKPDLIVSALPVPSLCSRAVAYGRREGVPVVVDVRDLWPDAHLQLLPRWARWVAQPLVLPMAREVRFSCRHANGITAPTKGYLRWALKYADRPRRDADAVFPMGYPERTPTRREQSDAFSYWREQFGLSVQGRGEVVCCFFGALGHQFDTGTVRAARILEDASPGFRFVLCGKGDFEAEVREMARNVRSVILPGWIDYPKIWALMRIARIGLVPYLNPSLYEEHLPNKPIEYMAGGLAIISSVRGAIGRLLEEHGCGLTYRAGDPADLANALLAVAENPERPLLMGRRSRQLFEERYRAEVVYTQMVEHLLGVARAHGRS